jgi:UDP-glucose 4-epimerase
VLVTGGLGFVGQAVARQLLSEGHRVAVLTSAADSRAEASGQNSPERPGPSSPEGSTGRLQVPPGAELVRADLRDRAAIAEVVAAGEYEGVCHLAALTRVRDSLTDPIGYFDINVSGTLNLLRALDAEANRTGRPARLVFTSTGSVYGTREGTFGEDERPEPGNPYAASKLAAEQMIGYQAGTGRLAAITLRCFNIAGAVDGRSDRDLSRIIPKTLAVAAGLAELLEINGDGSAVREYTHVLDVATAVALALDAAEAGKHRVFNVGSGQGVTLIDVVQTARSITGRPIPAEHRPPKPEAQILMADSSRIRRELGWRPVHSSLAQILGDGWSAQHH